VPFAQSLCIILFVALTPVLNSRSIFGVRSKSPNGSQEESEDATDNEERWPALAVDATHLQTHVSARSRSYDFDLLRRRCKFLQSQSLARFKN
jgi:hypothetical protein